MTEGARRRALWTVGALGLAVVGSVGVGAETPPRRGPVVVEVRDVGASGGELHVALEVHNAFEQRVCGEVTVSVFPVAERDEEPVLRKKVSFMNLQSGESRRLETTLSAVSLASDADYRLRASLNAATPLLPGASAPASHADERERPFRLDEFAAAAR